MVSVALEAASLLEAKGLSVGVADMWSLKPLDEDFVLKYASSVSAIVTLEEHQRGQRPGKRRCPMCWHSTIRVPV